MDVGVVVGVVAAAVVAVVDAAVVVVVVAVAPARIPASPTRAPLANVSQTSLLRPPYQQPRQRPEPRLLHQHLDSPPHLPPPLPQLPQRQLLLSMKPGTTTLAIRTTGAVGTMLPIGRDPLHSSLASRRDGLPGQDGYPETKLPIRMDCASSLRHRNAVHSFRHLESQRKSMP